jgi:hypothetical protein
LNAKYLNLGPFKTIKQNGMKKKMETAGKKIDRKEMKKLLGGLFLYCNPIGSWHGNGGWACCTGCFDGNYMCISCGVGVD